MNMAETAQSAIQALYLEKIANWRKIRDGPKL